MEPVTSLSGLTLGGIAAGWLANLSGKGMGKVTKRLHQRLRQGKLPVDGDLQAAVLLSFRAALHVLRNELAERLKGELQPAEQLFPRPEDDGEGETKPVRIRKLINDLARFSLIQRGEDSVSLIPVLAEVIARRLLDDEGRALRERWVAGFLEIIPDDEDYHQWNGWEHLQGHLLDFLSGTGDDVTIEALTTLFNNVGLYYKRRAAWTEAEPLMRRALEIDETSFGENHPNVAIRLNNLAQLLQATNRLAEAEPLMRRALEIDEASFGEKHPKVAIRLNNLAQLLKATNRLAEAEPLMRRALEIDEASFGENHSDVARDLNNLAQLLKATNRLAEAEPLMRRALEIFVRSLGAAHPNSQTVAGNYRLLLLAKGMIEDAAAARVREVVEGG